MAIDVTSGLFLSPSDFCSFSGLSRCLSGFGFAGRLATVLDDRDKDTLRNFNDILDVRDA